MKSIYIAPLLIAVVGIGLLISSASNTAGISLWGFSISALVVRGLGLIVLIFSTIAFLAAYGSTIPPKRQATTVLPADDRHKSSEDVDSHRPLSHRA